MSRSSRATFRIPPYAAIPLVVALLAAVLYLVNRALPPEAAAENWYQLYFTDPQFPDDNDNRSVNNIETQVVRSITAAKRTVDLASRDLDLDTVINALLAAHVRGVAVRFVTDDLSLPDKDVQRLVAAGIPVVADTSADDMHDKFMIIDGAIVWTGSWNFTYNSTYRNDNALIGIASPAMVANYQTEFDEMFVRGEFGPRSTADTPNPQFTAGGALIENYFAPEDQVASHIVQAIESATQSITIAAYIFTQEDILDSVLARAQAGVAVQGVFERDKIDQEINRGYDTFRAVGLPVLPDGNPYTMHHKFIVIDSQIVITGSYNYTYSSEKDNDENVLIIHDAAVAQEYLREFEKLWNRAGGN